MAENDHRIASLNKEIQYLLTKFEKVKEGEWADLGKWIKDVQQILHKHPSYHIHEKLTFSKRLAQCLNPTLPAGIQEETLLVYRMIFQEMKEETGENLEMYKKVFTSQMEVYSYGIFSFFPIASANVKEQKKISNVLDKTQNLGYNQWFLFAAGHWTVSLRDRLSELDSSRTRWATGGFTEKSHRNSR